RDDSPSLAARRAHPPRPQARMTAPLEVYGIFGLVVTGVAGLVVGSFLNVLVHRLPRGESVVSPGSRCPGCGTPIAAYDNVPVLSWIFLGGKCRSCKVPISVRYPLLELSNGVLWALVFRFAPSWGDFAGGAFLCSACLALLAIDAQFFILPDALTLPGIAVRGAGSPLPLPRTPPAALPRAATSSWDLVS